MSDDIIQFDPDRHEDDEALRALRAMYAAPQGAEYWDGLHRRILGAACVGPEASELIHEIVVAMSFGATAGALARIPHYHPTLSEIWTYPAEELAAD